LTVDELAELLWDRAAILTNSQCAHAAGIIRGQAGGRRAIDDSVLIEAVLTMVESGAATTIESASRHVAAKVSKKHSEMATARRLARKCRALASPTNLIKCLDRAPKRK
jgi:hypothetical protein